MVDKNLEENIKKTKDFIELWKKLQEVFKNTTSESHINDEKELEFLNIKELVYSRYEDLMDSLGVKPLRRFIKSPSVYTILDIQKLAIMSDEKLKAVDKNWEDSWDFLNLLSRRLEKNKKRLEGFNRFFFMTRKRSNKLK